MKDGSSGWARALRRVKVECRLASRAARRCWRGALAPWLGRRLRRLATWVDGGAAVSAGPLDPVVVPGDGVDGGVGAGEVGGAAEGAVGGASVGAVSGEGPTPQDQIVAVGAAEDAGRVVEALEDPHVPFGPPLPPELADVLSTPPVIIEAPGDYDVLRALRVETGARTATVATLTEQLRATASHIEEQVLGVCERFQSIARRTKAHVDDLERSLSSDPLEGARQEDFGQMLVRTGELLEQVVDLLGSASRAVREGAERVHALQDGFDEIDIIVKRVADVATQSKMLAVNARIEAAHAGELGRGFAIVAEQMAELSDRSRNTAETISDLVKDLGSDVEATVDSFKTLADDGDRGVREIRPAISDALAALAQGHDTLRGILEKASHSAGETTRDIQGAIVGLQFQDRTNQRISHVVESLEEIERALEGRVSATDPDAEARAEIEARTEEIRVAIAARYTMAEEQTGDAAAVDGGDVELF